MNVQITFVVESDRSALRVIVSSNVRLVVKSLGVAFRAPFSLDGIGEALDMVFCMDLEGSALPAALDPEFDGHSEDLRRLSLTDGDSLYDGDCAATAVFTDSVLVRTRRMSFREGGLIVSGHSTKVSVSERADIVQVIWKILVVHA